MGQGWTISGCGYSKGQLVDLQPSDFKVCIIDLILTGFENNGRNILNVNNNIILLQQYNLL